MKLREWFFTITATATKRGTRFKTGDRPTEETFKELTDSVLFKTEGNDRAKEDDSATPIAELNGHVIAATDVQAKANEAKKDDRTLVAQPSQLPTTVEDETASSMTYKELDSSYVESSTTHNDKLVDVTVDENTATRNNFVVNLFADFVVFLQGFTASFNDIVDKVKNINGRVNTNASAIATLQGSVGGNFDQLLPIGSTSFHINPGMTSDPLWKPADGLTSVSKYVTPGDAGSGNAVIYEMLSSSLQGGFDLVNDVDADYFLLPDLSERVAYQEFDGTDYTLGLTDGEFAITLDVANLPSHKHGAGTLSATIPTPAQGGFGLAQKISNGQPYPVPQISGWGVANSGNSFINVLGNISGGTFNVSGETDGGTGLSSPDKATMNPPKLGGGYLIKVA